MRIGLISLLLGCFVAGAKAEVLVTESVEHYLIAPKSEQDIKYQLRLLSPISKNNQTFHGGTRWQLDPYFRLYRSGNLCRIIQVSVRLHTTYTLPKIDPETSIPATVKDKFEQYYEALVEHEEGHHQIGIQAAQSIAKLLESQTPHYDCRQLKNSVQLRIQEKIQEYKLKHQEYDQRTGFGRSQGAVIR